MAGNRELSAQMTDPWQHRTLEDPADLEDVPPSMPFAEAQPWCNFVLWAPGEIPSDCEARTGTLRREAPPGRPSAVTAGRTPWSANNPSYRFEIVGDRRRLRVKQFLYDWAFPALDHPCLWDSDTLAVPLDGWALWLGVDYLGNRGASARLTRTTIEVSVLEGGVGDDELVDLYRSLRPIDALAATAIAATPFASLSYWARRPDAEAISVPVGLWRFRHDDEHNAEWTIGVEAEALVAEWSLPRELGGLPLDSAAHVREADDRAMVEVVYAGGEDRGRELRLVAQVPGQGRLQLPSDAESHPGTREEMTLDGHAVQLAWIDADHGPFDAVIARTGAGLEAKLLSSTGVGLDRRWFLDALRTLIHDDLVR